MTNYLLSRVAVIAIGRNEGERLRGCLGSITSEVAEVVYVDSGSVDDSLPIAQASRATVVELDLTRPFSAARARNAGVAARGRRSEIQYIQFVDGDCQVQPKWLQTAALFLETHPDYAVVCGRRRERFPKNSIYNGLCDLEWDTPVGDALYCGGDAMLRMEAFEQVGGFEESVIAGEEPELCVRLRLAGWKVRRLDAEMTLHDAAMMSWSQWCRRTIRCGYAYAQGVALHGVSRERHWVRESIRVWVWAVWVPLCTLLAVWLWGIVGLSLLSAYAALWLKTFWYQQERQADVSLAAAWATACVIGKFPECAGQLLFWKRHFLGEPSQLIEYKGTS